MKTNIDFTVIYEDDFIAVLNKRSGLSVASDRFDPEAPRLDVLASKSLGELYAVHRIDKDTSGAVLYARTAQAHKVLCEAFEKRRVRKCYHALVYGRPLWETLHVDLPLLADADARHRTLVHHKKGKACVTDFKCLGHCGPFSCLEAQPLTGRTHQIRAQAAFCGFPLLGDTAYGAPAFTFPFGAEQNAQSLFLHAHKLCFPAGNPLGLPSSLSAPLPVFFAQCVQTLLSDVKLLPYTDANETVR